MSLTKLNDVALDGYLRGEHGELMRREAQQVLYNRGRQHATRLQEEHNGLVFECEQDAVNYLKECGWVVFKPRTR